MDKGTKIGLITFGVFMTEAILHYNIGVNKNSIDKKLVFPNTKDFIKIGSVVAIFSIINGVIINKIAK